MSIIKEITIETPQGSLISGDIGANAQNIDYNNTESGLTADNVQDAIDEIAQSGGGSSLQNFKDGINGATIENDVTNNVASGNYSHAEGNYTTASGYGSHIEGGLLTAENTSPVALGLYEADSEGQIIKSSDSEIDDEKIYFSPPTRIIPFGFENPSDLEWYEQSEPDIYVWTEDTTVNNEKEYYQVSSIPMLDAHETKGWFSHAENMGTITLGSYTHAEGLGTSAIGEAAHTEGCDTIAIGYGSHTEGDSTIAHGDRSHTEGYGTRAIGSSSHAEGSTTITHGDSSHAEGYETTALGDFSHTEGYQTCAYGSGSHAEGYQTSAYGEISHTEGALTIAAYDVQHVSGQYNDNKTNTLFEIGNGTTAARHNAFEVYNDGNISTDNGVTKVKTKAIKIIAPMENGNTASQGYSVGEYFIKDSVLYKAKRTILPNQTFILNTNYELSDDISKSKLDNTVIAPVENGNTSSQAYAIGEQFILWGKLCKAKIAIAQGDAFTLNTNYEAADDIVTQIENSDSSLQYTTDGTSYAVIQNATEDGTIDLKPTPFDFTANIASGSLSHAEGVMTTASGMIAHSEGESTLADGRSSHAEGYYTTANHNYQHVQGKYNDNKSNTLFEVGNGTATTARSNAFEVYNDGSLSTDNGTTKVKLENVALKSEIPAAQVNSDWNASSGKAEILNKPTLGTAAALNVATTGDASTTEVVKGDDSRLTDARNAADVSAWAKATTKPIYSASEVGAIATTAKGAANGVAELDSGGKIPTSQLPSYVDDVVEYASTSEFPVTGESGKIYIALDTNITYRWGGSSYVEIGSSLALGETESTAYRGDRGKTAYDHSQITSGNPHNVTKTDIGLDNVGNFKAVSTVANQGLTSTEQSNARTNIGAGTGDGTITSVKMNGSTISSSGEADLGTVITSHQDISGKADKVTNATSGHFAGLDANGNLTDSGKGPSDLGGNGAFYGTCDTTASTAAKTVTCSDFTSSDLVTGTVINVSFTYNNTATDPTMSVNGTTAKPIMRFGTTPMSSSYSWISGSLVPFVYDGTNWVMTTGAYRGASTSNYGLVMLSNSTTSDTTNMAATPSAVKTVNDAKVNNTVVAPVESGTTASQTYAIGAQFLKDGNLYKAKTAIASGDTLTLNTNYEAADNIVTQLASGGGGGGSNLQNFADGENGATIENNITKNVASGVYSHAEGNYTTASGESSHAEGYVTCAAGQWSHAEGERAYAIGNNSHAEGDSTFALGNESHAEGAMTTAGGLYYANHAEGINTFSDNVGSHAEGCGTCATAQYSHTEGYYTYTTGQGSHAEGYGTSVYRVTARGKGSHAEGMTDLTGGILANGDGSHAEGYRTTASGQGSHSEGFATRASSYNSHAEGQNTTSSATSSHAEGFSTAANGSYSHSEGYRTTANTDSCHAEGERTSANGIGSHAEGYSTCSGYIIASGRGSHAEGYTSSTNTKTIASGNGSHAEGISTTASGEAAHAEGYTTNAGGSYSHTEGHYTETGSSADGAHAEGYSESSSKKIQATARGAHAEGYANQGGAVASTIIASGLGAHAEGYAKTSGTTLYGAIIAASGNGSHAEGCNTAASGDYSHAEGCGTAASNTASHAEGYTTCASGAYSHAEGCYTIASGGGSHAEGDSTTASGNCSHVEGSYNTAAYEAQHVSGKYNFNKSTTLMEVGNGTNYARSNAFEVYDDASLSTDNGTNRTKLPIVMHDVLNPSSGSVSFSNPEGGTDILTYPIQDTTVIVYAVYTPVVVANGTSVSSYIASFYTSVPGLNYISIEHNNS